ncbi:MAG: HAD-IA family hydrolase [Hyphomonadaceae bacterium]
MQDLSALRARLEGATIALDLDGTLVDTAPDLHRALNHVLELENLPLSSLDDVRRDVGQGARVLIQRSMAAHGIDLVSERLDELTEIYVEAYARDISSLSAVFPHVFETLDLFLEAGARLTVCTNKRTGLSRQLLDEVKLTPYFGAIVGADLVANRKPHADHFRAAVMHAGGDPGRAMMVGDSAADVGSARAAGAPVVVASFGYTDTAPELLGADAVFSSYSELPDLAVRLLA